MSAGAARGPGSGPRVAKAAGAPVASVIVVLTLGCYGSYQGTADAETGGRPDADVVHNAGTEGDDAFDGDSDAGADAGADRAEDVDARIDGHDEAFDTSVDVSDPGAEACVAETDGEFCARLWAACGALTATDNCGDERSVATCGECDDGDPCTIDSCHLDIHSCITVAVDGDEDGYPAAEIGGSLCRGTDCDDTNGAVFPGAAPIACSSADHDCNGHPDGDNDGDGHTDITCASGDDCNDTDPTSWSGAWYDATTGYIWEENPPPPVDTWWSWYGAVRYCDGLSLCGYPAGTWHLPTISELRSLIRGCPSTMTEGTCGVTDACLSSSCWTDPCLGCPELGGPGEDGFYHDAALSGGFWLTWSSSSPTDTAGQGWYVNFTTAYASFWAKSEAGWARCVRRGP